MRVSRLARWPRRGARLGLEAWHLGQPRASAPRHLRLTVFSSVRWEQERPPWKTGSFLFVPQTWAFQSSSRRPSAPCPTPSPDSPGRAIALVLGVGWPPPLQPSLPLFPPCPPRLSSMHTSSRKLPVIPAGGPRLLRVGPFSSSAQGSGQGG